MTSEVSWRKMVRGTLPKRECWKTQEALPKVEEDLIRECTAMHEERFLSSWSRASTEDKSRKKKEKEGECKHRKRKIEGEKERVAVVCKRACYESHCGRNLEEEVVDLSEDESEQLGSVSGCVRCVCSNGYWFSLAGECVLWCGGL